MPRFTILPIDPSRPPAELIAADGSAVLNALCRLDCGEANVLMDGRYLQSVRLDANGVWHIFQRDEKEMDEASFA